MSNENQCDEREDQKLPKRNWLHHSREHYCPSIEDPDAAWHSKSWPSGKKRQGPLINKCLKMLTPFINSKVHEHRRQKTNLKLKRQNFSHKMRLAGHFFKSNRNLTKELILKPTCKLAKYEELENQIPER